MCIPDETLIMSTTGKQKKKKKMEREEEEEDKQKNCASVEHWLEWLVSTKWLTGLQGLDQPTCRTS